MRKLSILRTKSFVGCLATVKVYIEDEQSSDLVINGVPCKKLGTLKNGETKEFEIGDGAAKVYVIADKLSKNFCNEFYALPEGSEDIYLSGRNRYNPANGNAFLFDANDNEETRQNRKKNTKKGIVILCIAAVVGLILGFALTSGIFGDAPGGSGADKTFTVDNLQITLTDEFMKTPVDGYTAALGSEDVAVFFIKEEFSLAEGFGDYTLEQYGELVVKNNGLTADALKSENGLKYFEYEAQNPDSKVNYCYVGFMYKANDAFWIVQFAVAEEEYEAYRSDFGKWAGTVTFN